MLSLCLVSSLFIVGCKKDTPVVVVEKCDASSYRQVTIGDQVWMVENYRCSKYATESEAYKEGRTSLNRSEAYATTPYYTDATKVHLPDFMPSEMIQQIGYMYNWAAAVGVADGVEQKSFFKEQRQGICPNGWHIPSYDEWNKLQNYIEITQHKGTGTAGYHLKTTSGWSGSCNGDDIYGFSAMAAGVSLGYSVYDVGSTTYFWTDATYGEEENGAYCRALSQDSKSLQLTKHGKEHGLSVRCLKNK